MIKNQPRKFATTILFSLVLVPLMSVGNEPTEVIWRFSHFLPATHSLARGLSAWAETLQLATDNRLKIDIYPAGQLGSGSDHYDVVRTRIAHVAWFVPGYEQGRFPVFSLLETPFLINDAVAGARSYHQWYEQYSLLEMTPVYPCLITTSPPGRWNFSQEAVADPENLRGMRVRVNNATLGRYVRNLGGVIVNLPASEIRQALEKGMIDAMPFDLYSIKAMSLDRILVYHLNFLFYSAPAVVGINRQALDSLPQDLRATVLKHCSAEHSGKVVEAWQGLALEAVRNSRGDKSRITHRLSAQEIQKWVNKAEPLLEEWKVLAARKGLAHPQQALEKLRVILSKNEAEFSTHDQSVKKSAAQIASDGHE